MEKKIYTSRHSPSFSKYNGQVVEVLRAFQAWEQDGIKDGSIVMYKVRTQDGYDFYVSPKELIEVSDAEEGSSRRDRSGHEPRARGGDRHLGPSYS